jgi:hypothetical protein
MTITAYNAMGGSMALQFNNAMVVVQLRVPNTGTYVVFGKVIISNQFTVPQGISVTMTTSDGATVLDQSPVLVSPVGQLSGGVCISLQGVLDLTSPTENNIVDIRCQQLANLGSAVANDSKLVAISVDALSGPVT